MITVKKVFESAYGEIPDGATCHIGSRWEGADCEFLQPVICGTNGIIAEKWDKAESQWMPIVYCDGTEENRGCYDHPAGPDISDRPAESFRGFFGKEYEAALDALIAESKHPLNDVKFSDATPEQFKEFWSAKGLTCWDGNIGGQLEFARCHIELTSNGYIYVRNQVTCVLVGEATTFGEAAEAIAALENALGRFGE